jgi:hypothetical protein
MTYYPETILASNSRLYTVVRDRDGEICNVLEGDVQTLLVTDYTQDHIPSHMIIGGWSCTQTVPNRYDFFHGENHVLTLDCSDKKPVDVWHTYQEDLGFQLESDLFGIMAKIVRERHA